MQIEVSSFLQYFVDKLYSVVKLHFRKRDVN
jgi:hypothetical protein